MKTEVKKLNGKNIELPEEEINDFRSQLTGCLIFPSDAEYKEEKKIWNAMIDRKPALIIKCMGTADVISSVRFAKKHDLLVTVRGAGHNIAGSSVADGTTMIDLSDMKGIWVDAQAKTARVGPGATLRNVDHETQVYGLVVPTGINSTTGISGLTLGGGFGWLSRNYGLTIDNLVSVEVVTADGKVIQANEKENTDVFWAVRGGSGNFGIVTSFLFTLHSVGPQILAGLIVHPISEAKKLFDQYKKITASAPEKLTSWIVLRKAPPLPFLPDNVHGKEIFVFAAAYAGDIKEGEKAMEPLRKLGKPIADVIGPVPYEAWQQALDPLLTPGARNYWKSHNFNEIDDKLIDILIQSANSLPSSQSEILFAQLGGAINKIAADATAYPHRNTNYLMNIHARWEEKSKDAECISWARSLFDRAAPYSNGAVYVNFISEGDDRVNEAFGKNYERLAKIKRKYDPDNFFRMNQNVKPA